MKTVLSIIFFLITTLTVFAQTDGISYQAVIIDPNPKELPGIDAQGNILPNAAIAIRFTIMDSNNAEEYQEVQTTKTDQFGMINLMIGQGVPTGIGTGDFTLISWDGDQKSLQVEIDFKGTGNNFVDMNRQELSFVPYAAHRDITATGTLTVDDATDLNGELRVHGPTTLNSSLDVNNDNATNLTGSLAVGAATDLNDRLTVNGTTNINDSLNINNQSPTHFSGDITVAATGTATFDGPTAFNAPAEFVEMTVNGPSNLRGQVIVRADRENVDSTFSESDYEAYPLIVEGSKQGIAIKVNGIDNDNPTWPLADVPMSTTNNFISFWDADENKMWGRIEGQSIVDLNTDPEFLVEIGVRSVDVLINTAELGIYIAEIAQAIIEVTANSTASTVCVGAGACVTTPPPTPIAASIINVVVKIANGVIALANLGLAITEEATFLAFIESNIGISYQSGAGDYAEWLPKQNLSDVFEEGELVGVKNGLVTKNTWGVEKIMIVSTRPIVLGNMPQKNDEKNNVKIAFMGQVPVKVIGKVEPGDYILPNDLGSGFAKAVRPENMETRDYKKVAGVAWSVMSKIGDNISIVNVAVGINTNDLSDVVYKQEEELIALRIVYEQLVKQMEESNSALASLVPGYAEAIGFTGGSGLRIAENNNQNQDQALSTDNILSHHEDDIIYFEVSDEQIEASIEMAKVTYQKMLDDADQVKKLISSEKNKSSMDSGVLQHNKLVSESENTLLIPIKDHPFWQKIDTDPEYKAEIMHYIKSGVEKSMHTHKKHMHNFTNFKVKE